ncbi:GTPase HflX [Halocatena halophila]|uniref:GTPase HflX n=1 Tax=Halocatena halophila TaxID=2814576 RepID=UPI002ED0718A
MSGNQLAIVAKRTDEKPVSTTEIRQLGTAAGYTIVAEVVQTRAPDPTYDLGAGKVQTLATRVATTDAAVVIYDGDLGPEQAFELTAAIGVEVKDRKRLVLDIFADRAETRRAQLEIRRAELEYELPRAVARAKRGESRGRQGFKSSGEAPGEQLKAAYKQELTEVKDELSSLAKADDRQRERRHDSGYDTVALAGYTNAGKSTLLRQLADEMEVESDAHHDLSESATVRDRLFETLNTTTRRATLGGRRILLTDTVGFVRELPHWLVESFEATLQETYSADVALLVVDASDPVELVREKTAASIDVLETHRDGPVLPLLNKIDVADDLDAKRDIVTAMTGTTPVGISAQNGVGLDAVTERVDDLLPALKQTTVTVPNDDEAMSLVSWLYDHANVHSVSYDEQVSIEFSARPEITHQVTGRINR